MNPEDKNSDPAVSEEPVETSSFDPDRSKQEFRKLRNRWAITIFLVITALCVIAAVMSAILVPKLLERRLLSERDAAIRSLEAIADLESKYRRTNQYGHYGDRTAVSDNSFLTSNRLSFPAFENYSMSWYVTRKRLDDTGSVIGNNTYTVFAYPIDTWTGFLTTFGVREDGIVRMYYPAIVDDASDVSAWPPADEYIKPGEFAYNHDN